MQSQPVHASEPAQVTSGKTSGVFAAYLNGLFAANEADPSVAAEQFLRALAIDPTNPDLLRQALVASVMSGRPDALALARRLPENAVARMLLGDEAARSGDWGQAAQLYSALSPDGAIRLLRPLLLAWAQFGAGQTDAALSGLTPLLGDEHFGGVYALHAAMIADLAGRTSEAARLYRQAEQDDGSGSIGLARIIASFEAREGHGAAAMRRLSAAGQSEPAVRIALPALARTLRERPVANALDGITEAYFGLAAALHADDQDPFATILLRLALDLRPDFTSARILAADILEGENHLEQAIAILQPISPMDPLGAMVQVRLAELTGRAGRTADALKQLHDLAAAFPDSPLPDAEAGDILRATGDFPGAVQAYSHAIARISHPSGTDWPLFYERGVSYEQSHQWTKAEADFETALRLQPNQPVVLNYLGYSWADRSEHLAQARKMIDEAARQRPDDGAIIDSLGWVMLRQGETTQAVTTLERAVELDPEDATINGHLGDAYWAAGRKTEATYQWRRALTLNPLPGDAAKLEAKLHETTAQAATVPARHIP
ncbi:MAG: tetratricopeptide repeat protein [Acetobacteraceae bacterium]